MLSSTNSRMSSAESHVAIANSFRALTSSYGSYSREAQRNGFVLDSNWDGQHLVYTIEPMSREDHAAFLAEEEEE